MRIKWTAACAILLFGLPAFAHRLDEYLQATIISIERDHVAASMRLIPGVAVSAGVIANIDSNHDDVISPSEQQAYAQRVLRDLSISIDGRSLVPLLLSATFPAIQEMKEGQGEIQIEFGVDLPRGTGQRKFVLENNHQARVAAYLVNCLVSRDKSLQVIAQRRNENQSFYQLDFVEGEVSSSASPLGNWGSSFVDSLSSSAGFASFFRLGTRHIAEGTDHLLFLLVLLLPAPLIVRHRHWAGFAGVRNSLLRISKVVTAFTVGHSITLALAALGVVRLPSRPIELLIAISILVSAIHAINPLFPGREAAIAGFFGLIHGLAFAGTLGQLGLDRWQRVTGLLGFNLGIETMQLIVVAATMPSLLLLSRMRGYPILRLGGAIFAGLASAGWIAERAFDVHLSVDTVVNQFARRAGWIASILFLIGLGCWSLRRVGEVATLKSPWRILGSDLD